MQPDDRQEIPALECREDVNAVEGTVDQFAALRAAYERGAIWRETNGSLDLMHKASYDYADKMTALVSSPGKEGGKEVEAVAAKKIVLPSGRTLGGYAHCSGRAISDGSAAQMMHFVEDAKKDIAYLGALAMSTQPASTALVARDVVAERERQKAVEGWTPEHDDAHTDFSLAKAACIYGVGATLDGPSRSVMDEFGASGTPGWMKELWPWDIKWWKPTDRRRDLVKAAALIIAEIERLDRSALAAAQSTSREDGSR